MNSTSTATSALFLADNLALDFINARYGTGERCHDCLKDDRSTLDWFTKAGLLAEDAGMNVTPGLLAEARELRDVAQAAVDAAMKGVPVDLGVINRVLEAGSPVKKLAWDSEAQIFRIGIHPKDRSTASLLWPVADSLASLITSDAFEFVRRCEAHDCVLLFHDLSKSHRRRWCSMATCGNRMKVAAFRARKKPE